MNKTIVCKFNFFFILTTKGGVETTLTNLQKKSTITVTNGKITIEQ